MKINTQYQKIKKEYVLSWEDLREKFEIKEEIDHIYFGGKQVTIVTVWDETNK